MSKREQNLMERRSVAIKAAQTTFEEKGIEFTKMTDIADASHIGVASLYRYFGTKSEIAVEVGINYWQFINDYLSAYETDGLTGLEGLKILMRIYTDDSEALTHFFRYIEHLDSFLLKLENKPSNILAYEEAIRMIEPMFDVLLEKGLKDGSIGSDIDIKKTYLMISHALTALKQKHCSRGLILSSDTKEQMKEEMAYIIDVFILHLLP